jgi:periplasmic protein TonB
VHISFLKEPRDAPPHWHCSFHIINRPQLGRQLKYFMRLVAIGFAYGSVIDDRGFRKESIRSCDLGMSAHRFGDCRRDRRGAESRERGTDARYFINPFRSALPRGVRSACIFVVCSGVALGGSQLAPAQDAASPTLLEPSLTARARPTPRPKKRTSERTVEISTKTRSERPTAVAKETISTKAPSETPRPAAEDTPPAEEPATPAPTTERKAHVKRRPTPPAQPTVAEVGFAATMSISAVKAVAVKTQIPDYPYEAMRAHITGNGICVMTVDPASGNVTSTVMEKSTGNGILDKVTTDAFRKWQFKPGTVSKLRVPISYE